MRHFHPFKALGQFVKEHTLTVIIFSLIGNTALAQLFYNSAGVILPNALWRSRYLIFSAVLSMVAFSLFELHVVRQLKELLGKAKEIRATLPGWELPAHIATLAVISAYNIYSLFLLNAVIWPSLRATVTGTPDPSAQLILPELPGAWKYLTHAVFYSLILFLAAVVVERKKTAEELASEEDDALHREAIGESNAHYRGLIRQGGRNVVIARQVLSTPQVAQKQERLLAALEGSTAPPLVTANDADAQGMSAADAQENIDVDAVAAEGDGIAPSQPFNANRVRAAVSATRASHGRQ